MLISSLYLDMYLRRLKIDHCRGIAMDTTVVMQKQDGICIMWCVVCCVGAVLYHVMGMWCTVCMLDVIATAEHWSTWQLIIWKKKVGIEFQYS